MTEPENRDLHKRLWLNKSLPPNKQLWLNKALPPNPFLAALREMVLQRSTKRCPKWKFRFAADLVLQLQPRPTAFVSDAHKAHGVRQATVRFVGRAVHGDLPADPFITHVLGLAYMDFIVNAYDGDPTWSFHMTGASYHLPLSYEGKTAGCLTLQHRIIAALTRLDHLDPGLMFKPACLNCGKPLTDPVSMARWIGPECASTSSLDVGKFVQMNVAAVEQESVLHGERPMVSDRRQMVQLEMAP
jgi:hypothetical protein